VDIKLSKYQEGNGMSKKKFYPTLDKYGHCLYIAIPPTKYRGKPVSKVSFVKEEKGMTTFRTDWPMREITIPTETFYSIFQYWD